MNGYRVMVPVILTIGSECEIDWSVNLALSLWSTPRPNYEWPQPTVSLNLSGKEYEP